MTQPKLARHLEAGQEQVSVYSPPLQHVPEYPDQLSSLASWLRNQVSSNLALIKTMESPEPAIMNVRYSSPF